MGNLGCCWSDAGSDNLNWLHLCVSNQLQGLLDISLQGLSQFSTHSFTFIAMIQKASKENPNARPLNSGFVSDFLLSHWSKHSKWQSHLRRQIILSWYKDHLIHSGMVHVHRERVFFCLQLQSVKAIKCVPSYGKSFLHCNGIHHRLWGHSTKYRSENTLTRKLCLSPLWKYKEKVGGKCTRNFRKARILPWPVEQSEIRHGDGKFWWDKVEIWGICARFMNKQALPLFCSALNHLSLFYTLKS